MARVRITPTRRKRQVGFAGMPGYISSTGKRPTHRPSEIAREWMAKQARDAELPRELDATEIAEEHEGDTFIQRRKKWLRMRNLARREPHKDWKRVAQRLRPKLTAVSFQNGDLTPLRKALKYWGRVDTLDLPPRETGYWGGYRFITRYSRAFAKLRVPEDLWSTIAADHDNATDGFSKWFRRCSPDWGYHVSWDEFTWCLFVYIMAYEPLYPSP